jgi:bifunctional aspartokinase / homoserine dehydrogenase 1
MKKYIHREPFILESNVTIDKLEIAYTTYGELNDEKDNIVWVFHAISGNSNVLDWWPDLFGIGKTYDPRSHYIICANTLGSPYGSTKPLNSDFPNFTVRDVVQAHIILAQELGINKIHTAIGGSFGGYQAIEFAYSYTGQIDHLILLASSAKESAWGIAIHESQRMALRADTTFGESDAGIDGMKAARAIAMLTYRTSEDVIEKQTDTENTVDNFKASSYINYHGDKFSKTFDALCFYYLTKCIDTHNLGRHRGGEVMALNAIKTPTLVIGFESDKLVPIRFQKFIAEHLPNSIFNGLASEYGHDGFLKEGEKITHCIQNFYSNTSIYSGTKRLVLKFGGTSLYGKKQLDNVFQIIKTAKSSDALAIIVSARGQSTSLLIGLFDKAKQGLDFTEAFLSFKNYLHEDDLGQDISSELSELHAVLSAISLLRDDSESAHDRVVAYGEIISAKSISGWLNRNGINAQFIDARRMIFTEKLLDEFELNMEKSRTATQNVISNIDTDVVAVVTGYIASSEYNKTVTLGRNGSNYSASLIANFIQAKEVQNWTDVDGIFSANPKLVDNAVKISNMTYREANEMANFGMKLLHPKTILPLMQSKIPLVIKSTLNIEGAGTRIDYNGGKNGIKAVTTIEDISLVTIEGTELSHKIGIDARIFTALQRRHINVKMISQASSERGIGFVISYNDATVAELELNKEFKNELRLQQISSIRFNNEIGIISIIGRHNYALEKAISTLRNNKIWMHLISNSISGELISLVVDKENIDKAAKLVHHEILI